MFRLLDAHLNCKLKLHELAHQIDETPLFDHQDNLPVTKSALRNNGKRRQDNSCGLMFLKATNQSQGEAAKLPSGAVVCVPEATGPLLQQT